MTFLISKYAKGKQNGLGEVPIGGEVQKLLPRVYATLHHPLHTKVALCIRLPLHWLGGVLHELWKKIGTKADIVNYRDITLVEHEGKPFVQFL